MASIITSTSNVIGKTYFKCQNRAFTFSNSLSKRTASMFLNQRTHFRTLGVLPTGIVKTIAATTSPISPRNKTIETASPQADRSLVLATNKIQSYILGIDQKPRVLSNSEIDKWLLDPFAELILKKDKFPLTLQALLKELEGTKGKSPGLSEYKVHHIAEGGKIPWNSVSAKAGCSFRLAISCDMKSRQGSIDTDILISTGKEADSKEQFFQVMSWDPKNLGFNFYQRLKESWIWAGNSIHALAPESRGRGPFAGHINGAPIMKELKRPWNHWTSNGETILPSAFKPNDPFLKSPLYNDGSIVAGGENFEDIVRAATYRWNNARMTLEIDQEMVKKPLYLMRQLLDTTNLNLSSSNVTGEAVSNESSIDLPITFFANLDAFAVVGISPSINAVTVSGEIYLKSNSKFNTSLVYRPDKKVPEVYRQKGDTFFAFLVPEPALDDINLLSQMIGKEIISPRLAASLLMVDFTNPIFSSARKSLLKYVSGTIKVGNQGKHLDESFVKAVMSNSQHSESEKEFLANWSVPEDKWKEVFQQRIEKYFKVVQEKLKAQSGFDEIMHLAESRRFLFKQFALFEFDLTLANTNISPGKFPLGITEEGKVVQVGKVTIEKQHQMK